MPRKIIIIPTFASSHFLDCWIQNVVDSIDPDLILICEGIMPDGPENRGHIDPTFRQKWCYADTNAGFDWEETIEIVDKWYNAGVSIGCKIIDYTSNDANECFLQAISDFSGLPTEYQPEIGTILMPLEPDAFHLEVNKNKIQSALDQLEIGQGIQTRWIDFIETQYYTEAINEIQPKWRRFAYRFDNMENYRSAMSGFMSQSYPKLKKIDDFITHHYPWFTFGSWKQLRYELIYRSDPNYWAAFDKGLEQIRLASRIYSRHDEIRRAEPDTLVDTRISDKIVIRPSRSDEGRYAKFIDIEHPNAIKSHPNYVK